jgi:ADP-ribose pyrophosphatase YjhB (NUDIX family)
VAGPVHYTIGVFANIFDASGRVLCVRQNYGARLWTQPGGGLEHGERPEDGLRREILEETGFTARIGDFIGIYHNAYKDDLILAFAAEITGGNQMAPNDEIAEIGWFDPADLPVPMTENTRQRIADAAAGRRGVTRLFDSPDHERC